MNTMRLEPCPEKRVVFDLCNHKLVPQAAGCYVISAFDDTILYIGLSVNLHNRFQQHLDNKEKTSPTDLGKPTWFHYLFYDKMNLERLERTWQNQYIDEHGCLPIFNKIQSPVA